MLPLLAWSAGFFYWHLRISRAFAELRQEASRLETTGIQFRSRLYQAGSRAIPALLRKDRAHALLLSMEFSGVFNYSVSTFEPEERLIPRISDALKVETLENTLHEAEGAWERTRRFYPPWWKWWAGRQGPQ